MNALLKWSSTFEVDPDRSGKSDSTRKLLDEYALACVHAVSMLAAPIVVWAFRMMNAPRACLSPCSFGLHYKRSEDAVPESELYKNMTAFFRNRDFRPFPIHDFLKLRLLADPRHSAQVEVSSPVRPTAGTNAGAGSEESTDENRVQGLVAQAKTARYDSADTSFEQTPINYEPFRREHGFIQGVLFWPLPDARGGKLNTACAALLLIELVRLDFYKEKRQVMEKLAKESLDRRHNANQTNDGQEFAMCQRVLELTLCDAPLFEKGTEYESNVLSQPAAGGSSTLLEAEPVQPTITSARRTPRPVPPLPAIAEEGASNVAHARFAPAEMDWTRDRENREMLVFTWYNEMFHQAMKQTDFKEYCKRPITGTGAGDSPVWLSEVATYACLHLIQLGCIMSVRPGAGEGFIRAWEEMQEKVYSDGEALSSKLMMMYFMQHLKPHLEQQLREGQDADSLAKHFHELKQFFRYQVRGKGRTAADAAEPDAKGCGTKVWKEVKGSVMDPNYVCSAARSVCSLYPSLYQQGHQQRQPSPVPRDSVGAIIFGLLRILVKLGDVKLL